MSRGSRAVAAAIAKVRSCITRHALPVVGGPVPPGSESNTGAADGELIVTSRTIDAFIAFYTDAAKAARFAPRVARTATRLGGQIQRHGAATILWVRPPVSNLLPEQVPHKVSIGRRERDALEACMPG